MEGFKIFPNYVTLSEADLVMPLVHGDVVAAPDVAPADAAAVALAGIEVEAEIEAEAAAARVLENQRIVSDLMYSDR